MLAIAINALYTTVRKRGTTRQLAGAIVLSVVCTLLLFPLRLWYNLRFSVDQAALSPTEIGLILSYVALCGWALPFGVMMAYCLFASPRDSNTAGRLARQFGRITRARTSAVSPAVSSRQSNVVASYVYNADTPWGWLEYRNGNFLGQELALKRTIVSIGREEDNEVWLDDDTISRYHAELVWENGRASVRDNQSLNGIVLNGRRIHASVPLEDGDELGIGSQRFSLKYAPSPSNVPGASDPLLPQVRRISQSRMNMQGSAFERQIEGEAFSLPAQDYGRKASSSRREPDLTEQQTIELPQNGLPPTFPSPLRLPSRKKEEDSW